MQLDFSILCLYAHSLLDAVVIKVYEINIKTSGGEGHIPNETVLAELFELLTKIATS